MSETFYITTPIYYPNGEPHLGSVYTTTICDVLAQYHRFIGDQTYFLTGTDEHGIKMTKAAAEQGIEPGVLAERYATLFKQVWQELHISFDDFLRTTEPRHKSAVQNIVRKYVENGDIYLGSYQGWYDEGQEEFVTETEAKNNEFKSKISGKPLTRYSEPTYFFRLAKYVPAIIQHIESHPDFIVPVGRRNEVLSKLRAGVDDLSISRATLKWGIEMPNDPQHVVYVWIDALTNYITALGYAGTSETSSPSASAIATPKPGPSGPGSSLFQTYWPANVHVIGKDILWFHSVYWPAMLLSLGLPLPKTIAAHGWWVSGGRKAGKSTGGITPLSEIRQLITTHSLDALRYYLLRAAPFGSDLEWSQEEFDKSFNELANVVGNLLNRTLNMIKKYRGAVPAGNPTEDIDRNLVAATTALPSQIKQAYEKLDLQQVVMLPIELARTANGYIDATRPFSLAKDPNQSARLDTVLNLAAAATKNVLVSLLPVLTTKARDGLKQLGIDVEGKSIEQLFEIQLTAGHTLGEAVPLFPRVEAK
ncbi:MAG TPA: methionine--tRNA ligase [Tepidisphaeraceae bacterium]|nr:methionine--tRNA ligase [Tepidisphaeraceae bacterium]